jgi:hypothetical protein
MANHQRGFDRHCRESTIKNERELVDVNANQLVIGKDWFRRDYSYLVQLVVEEK